MPCHKCSIPPPPPPHTHTHTYKKRGNPQKNVRARGAHAIYIVGGTRERKENLSIHTPKDRIFKHLFESGDIIAPVLHTCAKWQLGISKSARKTHTQAIGKSSIYFGSFSRRREKSGSARKVGHRYGAGA